MSAYLGEIARIHATRAGTGEVSYYGALGKAVNAAGYRLKPAVFCVPNLRNRGAGFPDMGLFVATRGQAPEEWPEARAPERGVVEVDDIPADLSVICGRPSPRKVWRWSDQIACVHMSGLLSRSHMNAGQDGFRDKSS